ncbi:CD209 antigen-like protein A isoform X2 [Labrus mixtus]|uniref:CD209 antigen-like protein A isoform X2 n=1 Tax=Labrus mixtus TaxID=508554 RepID=UPI0029C0FF34|nr:CD209 antigen-like protein A isoform X2 [Labrus mixtus]
MTLLKMSSNIYEEPTCSPTVSYSEGVQKDGAERAESVERVVDIYESADISTRDYLLTRDGARSPKRPPPAVQRNPFKAASLILALLCVLLVAAVTVLSKLYELNMTYKTSYEELSNSYRNSFCQFETTSTGFWRRFRCSCYYRSTEMRNWSESRADCVNRGADLVIINSQEEHDFLCDLNERGASWIGLQSVTTNDYRKEWEWKWVDRSTPIQLFWQKDTNVEPVEGSKVYINQGGKMSPTNNGSRGWICEKPVNTD